MGNNPTIYCRSCHHKAEVGDSWNGLAVCSVCYDSNVRIDWPEGNRPPFNWRPLAAVLFLVGLVGGIWWAVFAVVDWLIGGE